MTRSKRLENGSDVHRITERKKARVWLIVIVQYFYKINGNWSPVHKYLIHLTALESGKRNATYTHEFVTYTHEFVK